MKILLFGAGGQLGWELQRTRPKYIDLCAYDYPKVDFLNPASIKECIESTKPALIINAAAYTAVDLAEKEQGTADRINHKAVAEIAELCREKNIYLIHISTDFVFGGKNYRPYLPTDPQDPVSVYGVTKADGEKVVARILGESAAIIRTAWLYSSHGANFVKSMLNLLETKQELNIIDEQIGSPTWANGLAQAVWAAVENKITGIHHYSDSAYIRVRP